MSEEMLIDGKTYISSKRASQLSGYAQDYIGQLSRKALIDARRIGGLWYISMDSLQTYQKKAEEYKPEPPVRASVAPEPETLVFFDGKEYLSAARAAQMTGYAQDYVGQLARSGTVLSQQVGSRWYIEKQSILRHKSEKDRLLGAVQSESVGLSKRKIMPEKAAYGGYASSGPLLNYFSEEEDLLPMPAEKEMPDLEQKTAKLQQDGAFSYTIPIKKASEYKILPTPATKNRSLPTPRLAIEAPRSTFPLLLGAAATIIIVVSIGYASVLKQNSAYAVNVSPIGTPKALPASVEAAFQKIGDAIEPYLTHELVYRSPQQN
jgi:hypothetical protein